MSAIDEVARMFYQADDDEAADAFGGLSAFTVRVPVERKCTIEAMAASAKVSRNEMVSQLLRAGIEAVMSALPDSVREDIYADITDRISEET